jgi:hypothetical protein
MSISCECFVSPVRVLCVGRPTKCGVPEYDRESSMMGRPWPTMVVVLW